MSPSDVFRRTSSIEGAAPLAGQAAGERGSQVAAGPSPQPCVLHGALLGHVQLSQLASGDTCYTLGEEEAVRRARVRPGPLVLTTGGGRRRRWNVFVPVDQILLSVSDTIRGCF